MDFQELFQVIARNEFHYKKLPGSFDKMVADPWKGRVTQTRQHRGFTLELLTQPILGKKCFFDCDRSVSKMYGFGFINRTHTALR